MNGIRFSLEKICFKLCINYGVAPVVDLIPETENPDHDGRSWHRITSENRFFFAFLSFDIKFNAFYELNEVGIV